MKMGWRSFVLTLPVTLAAAVGLYVWWLCVDRWRSGRRRRKLDRLVAEKFAEPPADENGA